MAKALVIVESPVKAKTIHRYLGENFLVRSSFGHVRDLPTSQRGTQGSTRQGAEKASDLGLSKAQQQLVRRMGVDPYHGWKARYEILPGKEQVVKELTQLAAKVDEIYLATDLDREGEAIAWHLKEAIGGDSERYRRVVFNEITQTAIQRAFEQPSGIDMAKVYAQQCRRFLDRVVGYMVSPLLWKKVARGLSAGRVQSIAVRLVVEREREIKGFQPQEYWELFANCLSKEKKCLQLKAIQWKNGEPFSPKTKEEVLPWVRKLEMSQYVVEARQVKRFQTHPQPPFITATLQQVASVQLGFSVKKTMILAQRLYERGLITYMRTDSTHISPEALSEVRTYIDTHFGASYLPESARKYAVKGHAQEAHEAIRPSAVDRISLQTEEGIDRDAKQLYRLIWEQFVASQMTSSEYEGTTVTVLSDQVRFQLKGKRLLFDGFLRLRSRVSSDTSMESEQAEDLPLLEPGEYLDLIALNPVQKFTRPPSRYSEAALVKELEKRQIGRPSTYSTIISTIQERGYIQLRQKRFYAEKMGEIVTARLQGSFSDLMNYDFTAKMERQLDEIAQNKLDWQLMLNQFFQEFSVQLARAERPSEEGGMRQNELVEVAFSCKQCGRPMSIRTAVTGIFLSCTGYQLSPSERCKQTVNLIPEEEFLEVYTEDAEILALQTKKRCSICNTTMNSFFIDTSTRIYICGENPECPGYALETGEFTLKDKLDKEVLCDKCNAAMVLKTGRFGRYMACPVSTCGNTRQVLKNGELAPIKEPPIPFPELPCRTEGAYFVLRQGASGLFLAAHNFPRCRETRPLTIAELKQFRDRIPSKWAYLLKAPTTDPEGNPTIIRFGRKEKKQYVGSVKNGKITRWQLKLDDEV